MTVPCDGCRADHEPKALAIFMERGVQCRYCPDCAVIWSAFHDAHNAMAQRFNRLLEQWTEQERVKLPLRTTPLDFPALAATPTGALRLG